MRLVLTFICLSFASIWLSFFVFPLFLNAQAVSYLTYPVLAFTCALWGLSLVSLYRKCPDIRRYIPKSASAWVAILGVTGFHLLVEPVAFKIVLDEVILSASAQILHFTRLAGIAHWANDYLGGYEFINIMLDKRPFFFPFLLSLMHDLTGYRYQNVFILNGGLTLLLMASTYSLAKIFSSHRGGLLALLLTTTFPALSIMATSGHFEILNLFMLTSTVFLSLVYIRKPESARLVPLVLCLLLLAQVRYENVIYILPFGILILLGWKKADTVILPWQVMIAPLLLMISSLHYAILFSGERAFFQAGPNAREDTFSLAYAPENLTSALNFLFSAGFAQPNSLLISILGVTSLIFFLGYCLKRADRCTGRDPQATVMFIFLMATALLMGVIMLFNYGLLDKFITSRLSLPLHLFFLLLIPFISRRFGRNFMVGALLVGLVVSLLKMNLLPSTGARKAAVQLSVAIVGMTGLWVWIWKRKTETVSGLIILAGVFLLTVTMPISHSQVYSNRYQSNKIIARELSFFEELAGKEKILWVSSAPYTAFLKKINCVPPSVLNADPDLGKRHMDNQHYDAIYASRVYEKSSGGSFELMDKRDFLDTEVFELEVIERLNMGFNRRFEIARISQITPRESEESEEAEEAEEAEDEEFSKVSSPDSSSISATIE